MGLVQGNNALFTPLAQSYDKFLRFLELLGKFAVLRLQGFHNLGVRLGFQRFAQAFNALHGPLFHIAISSWRCSLSLQILCQTGSAGTPAQPEPDVCTGADKNNADHQPAHSLYTA